MLAFAENPKNLWDDLSKIGKFVAVVQDEHGNPTFNRSLANQASHFFHSDKQSNLRQLIQSAFATPYCQREQAFGRFGQGVHLVPPPLIEGVTLESSGSIGTIEMQIKVPISMPKLQRGFGEALARIRMTPAGQCLRSSTLNIGQSLDFNKQKSLWQDVADSLALYLVNPVTSEVWLTQIAQTAGFSALNGAIAHIAVESFKVHPNITAMSVAGAAIGTGAAGLSCEVLKQMWSYKEYYMVANKLEGMMDSYCSWIGDAPGAAASKGGIIFSQ